MAYPEQFLIPMRADLTRFGVEETRTPEAVDNALAPGSGPVLMVVNSVCGCAAGKARPAVGMALAHANRPKKVVTVFAGGDDEAVAHLREDLLADYPPSSPSMALFVDGKPVHMIHRREIEQRGPEQIAAMLREVFDKYCTPVS
jgi:putative YphP/YqiW family bacilliredoxin